MDKADRAPAERVALREARPPSFLLALPVVLVTLLLVLPTPNLTVHAAKIVATVVLFAINSRWGKPRVSYAFVLCLVVLAASLVPVLRTWNPIVVPATVFFILACVRGGWLSADRWLVRGRASRATWILFAVTIPVAAGTLIVWSHLVQPDLAAYTEMIPGNGLAIVLGAAIVFSVFNAVAEEVVFRGVLWQALTDTGLSFAAVLIVQAAAFGILHFGGVPGGLAGMGLATVYGLALGGIRYLGKGLLMPIVVHMFADLTIFMIVFRLAEAR